MKVQLKSLSGAFEGTAKSLEGIANALKREEPTPPIPPVSNYPRYVSFNYDDISTIYKINEDLSIEVITGYEGGVGGASCLEENNSIIVIEHYADDYDEMFKYDKITFELTNLQDFAGGIANLQWIDHPQS